MFNLLKEEKLRAEENMCYNKELCINDFCKPFKKLRQNKDTENVCFCYTNIIIKSNKSLSQISEDMATMIISKVTDRLLLKSKKWQ